MLYFIGYGNTNELYVGWAIEFTKLPASGRTKAWVMMKSLIVDDGWLGSRIARLRAILVAG